MFRENEASRIGDVLEAKAAGDRSLMIQAAVRLCLSPRETMEGPDRSLDEVWPAIVDANGGQDVVAALLAATREGQKPRGSAFVLLSEQLETGDLVALTDLVVERGWETEPYLAAVFARLVEHGEFKELNAWIVAHRQALVDRLDRWTLVGFIMSTTPIGDRQEVDGWFHDWHVRKDVPMWVLAAYASSFMRVVDDPWRRLIGLSHVVLANAARDATASFFETFVAIDHLASGRTEEFNASWSALERSLINVIDRPWVDNPIVRYANAVKRARPMQDEDFTYGYAPAGTVTVIGGGGVGLAFNLVTAAINHKKAPPRPLDLRTVQIVQTVVNHCHRAPNILSKFVEMTRQERNSPRARELYAEMSQRAMYPMLTPVWKRLVKQRVSLGARLKEHLKFHKI